jgi:hypothetical protein
MTSLKHLSWPAIKWPPHHPRHLHKTPPHNQTPTRKL